MPNDVKLQEGHPVDENLRPIKVGGKSTAIEIAQHGDGARVNGSLEVTGDIIGNVKDVELDLTTINSTDLTIDDSGDISLKPAGNDVFFNDVADTGENIFRFNVANSYMNIHDDSDLDNYFQIAVVDEGATTIKTVDDGSAVGHLTLDADGDIILDAHTGKTRFYYQGDTDDYAALTVGANGATTIATADSDGAVGHLTLAPNGKVILNSASGGFEMHGGGTTAKIADTYAGMILGYTAIGIDEALASESIGTSFAVTDATHNVTFIAPPSVNVEIYVSVYADQVASLRNLQLGLSDNATYNTLDVTHEHLAAKGDETDEEQVHHEWVITGLTAGTSYQYWLGAKAQTAGAYTLYWGGNTTGTLQPLVMKAIALPATIYTG